MKSIAIIGSGISGLFLANLLEKNTSFSYKIFEKKPSLDLSDGYGIQLSVNSINLLNKIGFQTMNASEVFFPKKVNFFDAKVLEKICDIDLSQFNFENNRYTTLKRSKLELERKLEQLRAMENEMTIHVGYINSSPLSVDTEKDLFRIKKLMEQNE